MAQECLKQSDVAVSVVSDPPVELAHQDRFEQSANFDVLARWFGSSPGRKCVAL
jgi:hypothetical protein